MEQVILSAVTLEQLIAHLRDIVRDEMKSPPTSIEEPIGLAEAARFIGLDEQTVYRAVRSAGPGKIPGYKRNGKWFFFKSELTTWIKGEATNDTTEADFLKANKRKGGRA